MQFKEITVSSKDYSTITFDQLSKQLNLDSDLVNVEYLESLIKASVDWIERRINSYITPTTLDYIENEFTGNVIEIDHTGVNNIVSLKINDTDITDYRIVRKHFSTIIILNASYNKASIKLSYEAGKTPANNYIQAVLIQSADFYEAERSNYTTGLTYNRTVYRLLNLE